MKSRDEKRNGNMCEHTANRVVVTTRRDPHLRGNSGFTLIELLMACAIIAVLSAMSIPTYSTLVETARVGRAKEEIRGLEKDIAAFQADRGYIPADLGVIGKAGMKDPWGTPYVYRPVNATDSDSPYTDTMHVQINYDYDLYSKGADHNSLHDMQTDPSPLDDVIRAGDGAMVVLAEKYAHGDEP